MKILIIRFSSFGDVVLTTPVIRAIKEKYPEAVIDFIVYNTFSEAISLNPKIRNLMIFDKRKSKDRNYIKDIINKLKIENYDYVIDLHSKFLSRIIGKSLENKNNQYCRYKKRKWWKTILVKAKLITYNADCTIVESYFTPLKKLGISFSDKNIKNGLGDNLEFYIDKKMEEEFIQKYDLKNGSYFVLAPGASKFTKKWPYYDELAKKILQNESKFVKNNEKLRIFVIGGKEDANVVKADGDGRVIDLCGKISFKESGILLKYAKAAIVNDSGPFHIARAVKAKTFVFFGPTDPKLFSFEKNTFLLNNPNCPPHSLYGDDKFPKKYADCMTGISVETVFEKIIKEYDDQKLKKKMKNKKKKERKTMKIIAFETSCDETSVAVVEDGKKILSNIISTQIDIHKEFGGVVPEIASRHHIENILPVFTEALEKANCQLSDIDYIAVTNTPGLIGSLLVGLMFAKSLSYANNIPLLPVNHINGHIFSSFIDNDVKLPAISLVVSGGHTNLYYIYEENGKIITDLLGETLDDAVGETYDKIARILGLEYPGGPHIDRLSVNGEDILKIKKPKVDGYNFSFSGIKTFITNYVNNQKMKGNAISKEDIAKSLQEIIVNVLYDKILMAVKEKDVKTILVAGGVSANRRLREKFSEFKNIQTNEGNQVEVHFPKIEYCTDNAAMIGVAAYYDLKNNSQIKLEKQYDVDAISTKN